MYACGLACVQKKKKKICIVWLFWSDGNDKKISMRPLTEEETSTFFEKLSK